MPRTQLEQFAGLLQAWNGLSFYGDDETAHVARMHVLSSMARICGHVTAIDAAWSTIKRDNFTDEQAQDIAYTVLYGGIYAID